MADTAIEVTAGTGTNVDTRTEATNGNHRQVIVIGDPSTNAGVAPVSAVNGLAVYVSDSLPAGTAAIGKLAANSGVDIGDVDITSILPGSGATNLGKLEDAAHSSGDLGVMALAVRQDTQVDFAADGDYVPLSVDGAGGVRVTPLVTMGSGSIDSATVRVAIATDQLESPVAHDAADANSPTKIGAKATTSLAGLTLVADADRTNLFAGIDGVQFVRPHAGLEDMVSAVVTCTAGANTSAVASQGAGVKFYLMGGMIFNTGASNGSCLLTDGSGGTTKLRVPFPASTGTVFTLPVPIGFSAATAVYADPSGSDDIAVTLYGFKSKI
jgi:hypothetical protein